LLVFNDTRVIKARFFGVKESGGRVEIMLERIVDATHAICQIRASKAPKRGGKLILADAFSVTVTGRAGAGDDFFALELNDAGDFWELAE
ncbi:S-adenosylmethionine:tRNA ribosyltransferase-isomerase, partial [Mycobacterium ulcerans]